MPLPFALLAGFAVGVVLASMSRRELVRENGPLWQTRVFTLAAAYGFLVLAPVAGYFAAFHGDWAYLYTVPWRKVPSAVDLSLVLAAGGAVPLGVAVAAAPARGRRIGVLSALAAAPTLAMAVVTGGAWKRLLTSATYAQFHGHFGGEPLARSSLGRGVAFMGTVLIVGTVVAVQRARRDGGEFRRDSNSSTALGGIPALRSIFAPRGTPPR